TSRHTEYFRAENGGAENDDHVYPSGRLVAISVLMLLIALTGIILIAKKFAVILELGLSRIGAPPAVSGIIIAMVVLAPEVITAYRAARHIHLHKRINIAHAWPL